MKICLDNIIFYIQRAGGITTYWYELILKLKDTDHSFNFIEQKTGSDNIYIDSIRSCNLNTIIQNNRIPTKISRYFNFKKNFIKADIFHSSYYRIYKDNNVKNIVTVYDFTYEFHRKGLIRAINKYQKNRAINNADGIICISENTKNDLIKLFPKIDKKTLKVIYLAVGDNFFQIKNKDYFLDKYLFLKDKNFIIFIGDRIEYKKFNFSIDIISKLKEFYFVIIGGGNLNKKENSTLQNKLGDRFIHLKYISNNELNFLYNKTFCLLYPSVYEGFGIPVLEAMTSGCPVVLSNTASSSLPEIAANAAIYCEQNNIVSFIKNILQLRNKDFRKNIIQKGLKQASKFSWEKCAKETLAFYTYINNQN